MKLLQKQKLLHLKLNLICSFLTEKINSKSFYILFIGIIYCCLFYLNVITPFIGDDYVHSFIYTTTTKISNLSDILMSQLTHYKVWGGRSIVHFILQLILLIKSPVVINCINSLLFVLYIFVVQFHILGKIKFNTNITFVVFSLTCILQPAFGETCLWLTGSVNYLWGTTIILYFLLPYRLYINSTKHSKKNYLQSLLAFIFGIITGWTNENTVAALIVIISLLIIYQKKQKSFTPSWWYWGLSGVIIGYVIMIAAPGNFARASEAGSPSLFVIIFRIFSYTQFFTYYLSSLNLGLIISFILFVKFCRNNFKQQSIIATIYFLGVLVSIYSMIFSPSFPSRTWFSVVTLNIIAFGIIFYNLNFDLKFLRAIKISLSLYCMLNVIFVLYEGTKDIIEINNIWDNRINYITRHIDTTKEFTFKKYKAKTKFGMSDAPYADRYVSNFYNIDFRLKE